jgi:hypothetical protein
MRPLHLPLRPFITTLPNNGRFLLPYQSTVDLRYAKDPENFGYVGTVDAAGWKYNQTTAASKTEATTSSNLLYYHFYVLLLFFSTLTTMNAAILSTGRNKNLWISIKSESFQFSSWSRLSHRSPWN